MICFYYSNSRYYSQEWLGEAPDRVAPHQDLEIAVERNKFIERYFTNDIERRKVNEEYAAFTSCLGHFSGHNSINDRAVGVFALKLVICKYDLNINKRSSTFIHFMSYFIYITCALNIQDCQM